MTYSLPTNGESNWGTPLNNYILNVVLAQANLAETNFINHEAASDPHGDKAYALSLVSPITSGTNAANGYVKLNSSGLIPNNLLPSAGGLSDVYDVSSSTFGGVGNVGVDNTAAIQAALTACANAGGGEVWIPNGSWTISSTLVIGNNTFLNISPGATMLRGVSPTTGLRPAVMLANFSSSTSIGSLSGNILVSGGTWDSTSGGTVTTSCNIFQFANASFVSVQQTKFVNVAANQVVQLFGMNLVSIENCSFLCYKPSGLVSSYNGLANSVIRVATANSTELPSGLTSGMYSNALCSGISVNKCVVPASIGGLQTTGGGGFFNGYSALIGSTNLNSSNSHTAIAVSNCYVVDLLGRNPFMNTPGASGGSAYCWNQISVVGNTATYSEPSGTNPSLYDSSGNWIAPPFSGNFDGGTLIWKDNNPTLDAMVWQSLAGNTNWSGSGGGVNGFYYRVHPDQEHVECYYDMAYSGTSSSQITMTTLPTVARPAGVIRFQTEGEQTNNTYWGVVFNSGAVQVKMQGANDTILGHLMIPYSTFPAT